ncbi:MAG: DUF86 domain-containing protein [bacterium]|nr:DUF86 domain-containing protein [bacterium]
MSKDVIQRKMVDISRYLVDLQTILKYSASDIVKDPLKLHTIERLFQLIVDASIDINTHIIASKKLAVVDDYQSTFISLGENGIVPMKFAVKIAPAVGLRNRVVHRYGDVRLTKMISDIKHGIKDFDQYLKYMSRFLEK